MWGDTAAAERAGDDRVTRQAYKEIVISGAGHVGRGGRRERCRARRWIAELAPAVWSVRRGSWLLAGGRGREEVGKCRILRGRRRVWIRAQGTVGEALAVVWEKSQGSK